jgi:voltage-gated potassium channel Kch
MNKVSFSDRLRYAFDNYMSKGTIALLGGLFVVAMIMITLITAFVKFTGIAPEGTPTDFFSLWWMGMVRTLDTGTMGGDTGSLVFLLSMLAVTLGGVFTVSALIGVLNNGLEGKLEEMRKGRSRVIETGHTVILGWSEQVFSIISELVLANANQKRPCIVILGEKDKVEMEEEIRDKIGSTGRTRVVCRSGSPIDLVDLEIASVQTSRSIIVLAPEGDEPDSSVIKTILAITNSPKRRTEPYHIVAEIGDPKNLEVARMVGRDEAELVLTGDLISRIVAQTCRQSGLSVVYTELLDFGGDEIYFKAEPALTGKTFGESLLAYEDSTVMGLRLKTGGPRLNPPMDTRIEDGDHLIVVSEDDDTIKLSGKTDLGIKAGAIHLHDPAPAAPERTLILGWNRRVPAIVNELDNYVAPGSEALVVADVADAEAEIDRLCVKKNQAVKFQEGDTTDRRTLDELAIPTYKHIIVLSYAETLDPQQADARTLITLLHLRDIAEHTGHPFSIVSEMLDVRNRALAEVTQADDFIVSDKLISLMLSQISENKELNAVFADIFDPEGSEIYLKLASNYVALGEPLNFYTVVEAARRRGEVALGYRLRAHATDPEKAYGVVVNPDKSNPVTFSEWDRVIVLAEN